MRMYDLITKKKHGGELTAEELRSMVEGYVAGEIPDYQMSAMLMAIWFSGMTAEETTALTIAMADSGDRVDLSAIAGKKVDKQKKELERDVKDAKIESVNDGQAIRVTFDSGILFATGSATLSSTSQATLRKFAANLSEHSDTDLMIIGHTDNTGTDRVNNPLSYNRAASVRSFLAGQGVSSSRMKVEGKGSYEPVADNSTAAGRRENRRVEVYILPSKAMVKAAQDGTLR